MLKESIPWKMVDILLGDGSDSTAGREMDKRVTKSLRTEGDTDVARWTLYTREHLPSCLGHLVRNFSRPTKRGRGHNASSPIVFC